MFIKRAFTAAAGVVFSVLAIAAPASAITADRALPAGETLYVLPCEDGIVGAVYVADVSTGELTQVGPDMTHQPCWSAGYFNPVDGLLYAVDWNEMSTDDPSFYYLSSINPQTGVTTQLVKIQLPDSTPLNQYSIARSPSGVVYVSDSSHLYVLDVATGATTLVGEFSYDGGSGAVVYYDFYSLAFSPDGTLYGNSWNGTGGGNNPDHDDWFTIDPTDASLTPLTTATGPNAGLTFDSAGVAWYQLENTGTGMGFASGTFDDLAGTQANLHDFTISDGTTSQNIYSESLIVATAAAPTPPTPAVDPTLANTGAESSVAFSGMAGALLLVVGAGVVLYRRRTS